MLEREASKPTEVDDELAGLSPMVHAWVMLGRMSEDLKYPPDKRHFYKNAQVSLIDYFNETHREQLTDWIVKNAENNRSDRS